VRRTPPRNARRRDARSDVFPWARPRQLGTEPASLPSRRSGSSRVPVHRGNDESGTRIYARALGARRRRPPALRLGRPLVAVAGDLADHRQPVRPLAALQPACGGVLPGGRAESSLGRIGPWSIQPSAPRARARRGYGRMFWFSRKTLSGSQTPASSRTAGGHTDSHRARASAKYDPLAAHPCGTGSGCPLQLDLFQSPGGPHGRRGLDRGEPDTGILRGDSAPAWGCVGGRSRR